MKNDVINHVYAISNKQVIRYIVHDRLFSEYRKVINEGDSVLVDFANEKIKSVEIVLFPEGK